MSEQAQDGRLMTFEEFAPQCIVVADRWIENHPQDPGKDWSDTYALARTLRDCIQRGIDQLQRETERNVPMRAVRCDDADCSKCRYCHEEPDFFTGETQQWCMDSAMHKDAADRLESQERSIEEAAKLNEKQANTIAFHERDKELMESNHRIEVAALIARAESAEAAMKAIIDTINSGSVVCGICSNRCGWETCKPCSFKWRGLPQEGEQHD